MISSILQHSHSLKSDLTYKPSTIFQQIKVKGLSKGQGFTPAKPMKHQLTLDALLQRTLRQIHESTAGVGYFMWELERLKPVISKCRLVD